MKDIEAAKETQLFRPFRAVGFVCDHTPFFLEYNSSEPHIITSIGHNYHSYNLSQLKLTFSGDKQERKINSVVSWKMFIFTTCGPNILRWSRGKLQETYEGHTSDIYLLYTFGDILISVSKDHCMNIWHLSSPGNASSSLYGSIQFPENFTITSIVHPHTYLNKILVGSDEGIMQIWNIRSKKMIYQFTSFDSSIICMEQSPALDVIGIGLQDGRILIKNIKQDKNIAQFLHNEGGPVTSLSFRDDKRHAILVSGNFSGQIAIWDLNKKKLSTIMNDVHDGPISSLKFVPNEPLLITSGRDNSLKVWIFDQSDGTGRLLRFRSGHYDTPTRIRFYNSVQFIVSVAEDHTMRMFNVFRERQNRELSQGKLESKARKENIKAEDLKLPIISQFSTSTIRERDWDNIISIHRDSNFAYTWNWRNKKLGKHRIRYTNNNNNEKKRFNNTNINATSSCISQCGNYSFIGFSNGTIQKFNIQSGLLRASTNDPHHIHFDSVTSVVSDLLNLYVISGSLDGSIKFWSLQQLNYQHTIEIESPIIQMELQRESNLLIVVTDDLILRLYDIETKRLVRKFTGHSNQITDVCFSNDSRWLVSSSLDCTVRIWDIITGKMIDWFRTRTAVVSLTFSPTGEFLATAQLGSVGIFLWSNKNHYSKVFLQPPEATAKLITLPSVTKGMEDDDDDFSSDEESSSSDDSNDDDESLKPPTKKQKISNEDDEEMTNTSYPSKLSDDMITLSSVPRDRIKTIINLEQIKARNKPKEAPSAPKIAPFLLPSTGGINPELAALDNMDESKTEKTNESSKILNLGKLNTMSPFLKNLQSKETYEDALEMLNDMSPSAIDLEIRQLTYSSEIKSVLNFIQYSLEKQTCFELIQALLNILLKIKSDEIIADEDLVQQVVEIKDSQSFVWHRLEQMFHYNQCLISHLSGLQI